MISAPTPWATARPAPTGSSGPESCPLTLLNDASSAAIPLGFSIDFGTGPVSTLFVNENGVVSFNAAVTPSSFTSLASLGQPVIAPFFADLTSVTFQGTVFEMFGQNFGQLMYQRGSASALPNGTTGNFEQSDEVPAFAVLWYGPTDANGVQVFTQLVIFSHASSGAGDFDIGIRYGQVDGDSYNNGAGTGANGIAGLVLGTNTLTISGPLAATTDYFYSFRGGKLVGGPPPPVTVACPSASAQVGTAYSSAMTATGGVTPYTFSNTGSLPPGLLLNAGTGAVTGTPTAAGTFAFTAHGGGCRRRHGHEQLQHHGRARGATAESEGGARQRLLRHGEPLQPAVQDRDADEHRQGAGVALQGERDGRCRVRPRGLRGP